MNNGVQMCVGMIITTRSLGVVRAEAVLRKYLKKNSMQESPPKNIIKLRCKLAAHSPSHPIRLATTPRWHGCSNQTKPKHIVHFICSNEFTIIARVRTERSSCEAIQDHQRTTTQFGFGTPPAYPLPSREYRHLRRDDLAP